jgi:glycosyltransferase involved in cell wall biosynthesis
VCKGYVLVTPAHNEEAFIEKTLRSVVSQTVLPRIWVVVSDSSIDRTDVIVSEYSRKYDFIKYLRIERNKERNFGAKVNAFNRGYDVIINEEYQYVGILDADISLDANYYESVIAECENNERLGVAGGIRYDFYNGKFHLVRSARNSVGGPFQLFRRKCFEDIGGFIPIEGGGEDAVAETMARMYGWEVESFCHVKAYHHRRTGTAKVNVLRARFRDGIKCYVIGNHPVFQIAKGVYRLRNKPYIIGSVITLCGYVWAWWGNYKRVVPDDFVEYLRCEQWGRLRSMLYGGKKVAVRA